MLRGTWGEFIYGIKMATKNTTASDGHPTTHIRNFLFGQTGMSTMQYLAADQRRGGPEDIFCTVLYPNDILSLELDQSLVS
jgi:hypothetical protein